MLPSSAPPGRVLGRRGLVQRMSVETRRSPRRRSAARSSRTPGVATSNSRRLTAYRPPYSKRPWAGHAVSSSSPSGRTPASLQLSNTWMKRCGPTAASPV
ncbi:hypothetical protein ACFQ0B_59125 [Nonomuraea thailandensis]